MRPSHYLWRGLDDEGEVLDLLMQRRRDTQAAKKSLMRPLGRQPIEPNLITTYGHRFYSTACPELGWSTFIGRVSSGKKQGGELSSAHPPTRTANARLQKPVVRPAFSHYPPCRAKHLLHPTTPDSRLKQFRTHSALPLLGCHRTAEGSSTAAPSCPDAPQPQRRASSGSNARSPCGKFRLAAGFPQR